MRLYICGISVSIDGGIVLQKHLSGCNADGKRYLCVCVCGYRATLIRNIVGSVYLFQIIINVVCTFFFAHKNCQKIRIVVTEQKTNNASELYAVCHK